MRGDPYEIAWRGWPGRKPELAQIANLRELEGWGEFHSACGDIAVYFDNYTAETKRVVSVRVFTTRPNKRLNSIDDLVYLCRGEGHDAVSASIDGLRKSGGSSLKAWLAALKLQLEQLDGMIE